MTPAARALGIPAHANKASMLLVDVFLGCPGKPGGYKSYFVVEWSGWQVLPLRLSSFETVDAPWPKTLQDEPLADGAFRIAQATHLRLQVRDACTGYFLHPQLRRVELAAR